MEKQASVLLTHWKHYTMVEKNKFGTDTTTWMNHTNNLSQKKAKLKRAHPVIPLNKVQEKAKLIYSIRGQNSGPLWAKGAGEKR